MTGIYAILAVVVGLVIGVVLWVRKRDEPRRTDIRADAPTLTEDAKEAQEEEERAR